MKRLIAFVTALICVLMLGCQFPDFRNMSPAGGTGDQSGLDYSVQGVPNATGVVSLQTDTATDSGNVVLEGMKAVFTHPVIIRVTGRAGGGDVDDDSFVLEVAVPEKPDVLLVMNRANGEKEIRPFTYDDSSRKMVFSVSYGEQISFIPATLDGAQAVECVAEASDQMLGNVGAGLGGLIDRLTSQTPTSRPFNVRVNDGHQILVQLNSSYFRKSTDWNYSCTYYVTTANKGTLVNDIFHPTIIASGSTSGLIRVSVPGSGVYTFTVKVRFRNKYRWWFFGWHYYWGSYQEVVRWRQDVIVETHALSDALRGQLANRYAPIVVWNYNEHYRPASLEYLFNKEEVDPALSGDVFKLTDERTRYLRKEDKFRTAYFNFGDVDRVLPYYGHRNAMIDFTTSHALNCRVRLRQKPGQPVVYYTFQERDQYDFIHYHFLYAYDLKSGSPSSPGYGSHVFDRESLVVVLHKTAHTPLYTIYGGHMSDSKFHYLGGNILDWKVNWENGRVKRDWASDSPVYSKITSGIAMDNDTIRAGTHPLAFIAEGSHAVYPYPGRYKSFIEEHAGCPWPDSPFTNPMIHASGWDMDQILLPPGAPAGAVNRYDLRDLGVGRITSSSWNRILAFSGWMIDVLGETNARFPPYTARETKPEAYFSGADTVAWRWISPYMRDRLEDLEGIIDEYYTVDDPFAPY